VSHPQRLIEGEEVRPKHGATRALVPVPPGICPACGAELHVGSSDQPALFIHGGFGEVRRRTERSCSCGWNGIGAGDFTSENPRKLA
jgi:hypothetical protein